MRVCWLNLDADRRRRLLGWVVSVCALIGLNLTPPGPLDRLDRVRFLPPLIPNEEDETAPVSESSVIVTAAHEQRSRDQWTERDSDRYSVLRLHSHTPSTGFETAQFRPPPDHFNNGLGAPIRC